MSFFFPVLQVLIWKWFFDFKEKHWTLFWLSQSWVWRFLWILMRVDVCTHCQDVLKSVGSHCRSLLKSLMKVMVWCFMSDLILYDCTHYYVILNLLLWWFWWDLQNWSDLWMRIVMGRSSKSLCRYVSKVSTVNKMSWYNTGVKTFLLQPISCKFRDLYFCFRIPQILWQEKAHHLG